MTRVTFAAVLGASLGLATGGGGDKPPPKPTVEHEKEKGEHDHGAGPHGGTVIELGSGKYHGEFTADHGKKEVTVYLLKEDVKTPARFKTDKIHLVVTNTTPKIELDLLPTDAGPDGKASTFRGTHEGFGTEMEYKGSVQFVADGKPYAEDFAEEPEKK